MPAHKRKSDAWDASSSKKSRTSHSFAKALIKTILVNPDSYPIPDDDDTRQSLVELAHNLRKAAHSGIKKQMTWKPSCKAGTAKWCYDGVCANPVVFDEFENPIGDLNASASGYSDLYVKGQHVNIRWSNSGEFKFSGTYGA
ncbi:uncharacterized protein EDB91DRAFT_1326540 [Suillus paluster]|uniref:uncharacterized protein n=1 Tax=Suillus paluster TaxID=48578 RepID=UPI001B876AFF|nr:uncharacterized protein EDB91DRAFT_1326540 [Suillus paluster]KAG1752374.1 hypothetical protein EDB91DRAFT_1326540 [Suillus paluster]